MKWFDTFGKAVTTISVAIGVAATIIGGAYATYGHFSTDIELAEHTEMMLAELEDRDAHLLQLEKQSVAKEIRETRLQIIAVETATMPDAQKKSSKVLLEEDLEDLRAKMKCLDEIGLGCILKHGR